MLRILLIQLLFAAINYFMALYHAYLIKRNKPILHAWWATAYVGLAAPILFLDWLLFASLLIMRLPLFNSILNYYRDKPLYYLGKGSVIDRLIRKVYPAVFWGCIGLFIMIELIIFI